LWIEREIISIAITIIKYEEMDFLSLLTFRILFRSIFIAINMKAISVKLSKVNPSIANSNAMIAMTICTLSNLLKVLFTISPSHLHPEYISPSSINSINFNVSFSGSV